MWSQDTASGLTCGDGPDSWELCSWSGSGCQSPSFQAPGTTLVSDRWNWNVLVFFQSSKRQISSLIWTVSFRSVTAFCGGLYCVWGPQCIITYSMNEPLSCQMKAKTIFFFLRGTYTRKQLTHAYKILIKNFSLIKKLLLSLEKSVTLEQGESSSLLYKFSCALKLIGQDFNSRNKIGILI